MTGKGTGSVTPLCRSNQISEILLCCIFPQFSHDYPASLITINHPITDFFFSAPATFANIIGVLPADRLAGADHLLLNFLAHR